VQRRKDVKPQTELALRDFLADWLGVPFGPRDYELAIIEKCESTLTGEMAAAFRQQVACIRKVSRYNSDRMALLILRKQKIQHVLPDGLDRCLFSCVIQADDRNISIISRIFLSNGYLHRLEFSQSPRSIWKKSFNIYPRKDAGSAVSIAEEIDREEHSN
jgi:hypothetical protein